MNCCNDDNYFSTAKVGLEAPDFTSSALIKGDIKNISLSDYRGKWVLLFFYPLDFTFICPTELRELAKNKAEFAKLNVEILPISTDSAFSHKAWQSELGADFDFTWLSDMTKEIALSYGVLIEDEGIALRGAFIIDDQGVLRSSTINSNSVGRSSNDILRTIKALQTGELCPASWDTGDKTLGKA